MIAKKEVALNRPENQRGFPDAPEGNCALPDGDARIPAETATDPDPGCLQARPDG